MDSGLPDGVGLEVFSFNALEAAHCCGLKGHHREHVNEYILETLIGFAYLFSNIFFLKLLVPTYVLPSILLRIYQGFKSYMTILKELQNEMDLASVVKYCSREAL